MPEDRTCLTRVELARKIRFGGPEVEVEVSVEGKRYEAAEVAIYKTECGKTRICIIGRI